MPVRFDIFDSGMVKEWETGGLFDINRSDIASIVALQEEDNRSLFTGLNGQLRVGRVRTFAARTGIAQSNNLRGRLQRVQRRRGRQIRGAD